MTIGSLFSTAVGSMLSIPATVEILGVELGTLGVILLILVLLGGLLLSLWALWVVLFFIGSR
jgi:energy-converting hydrogenase Eha subunit E